MTLLLQVSQCAVACREPARRRTGVVAGVRECSFSLFVWTVPFSVARKSAPPGALRCECHCSCRFPGARWHAGNPRGGERASSRVCGMTLFWFSCGPGDSAWLEGARREEPSAASDTALAGFKVRGGMPGTHGAANGRHRGCAVSHFFVFCAGLTILLGWKESAVRSPPVRGTLLLQVSQFAVGCRESAGRRTGVITGVRERSFSRFVWA